MWLAFWEKTRLREGKLSQKLALRFFSPAHSRDLRYLDPIAKEAEKFFDKTGALKIEVEVKITQTKINAATPVSEHFPLKKCHRESKS